MVEKGQPLDRSQESEEAERLRQEAAALKASRCPPPAEKPPVEEKDPFSLSPLEDDPAAVRADLEKIAKQKRARQRKFD